MPRAKNTQAKRRPVEDPYEVWRSPDGEWEWKVLKKYQVDDNKPYAKWLVAVKSPYNFGGTSTGDEYVATVKRGGRKVEGEGRP